MTFITVMQNLIKVLARVNETISETALRIAAVLLALMVTVVLAQVFFRYVLNDSLIWSEEIAKVMMVWTAFLVAPKAYRSGSNVAIHMLVDSVPEKIQQFLSFMISSAVLWIVAIYFEESLGLWSRGWGINAASLPVAMAWFYSIVPVGLGVLFLVGLELFFRDFMTMIDSRGNYKLPSSEVSVTEDT